jgi:type II secretion system protein J
MRLPSPGFTLIELLVAMSLMGISAVMAARGVEAMIRNEHQIEVEQRRWQRIARFLDRFQLDISQPSSRRLTRDGRSDSPLFGFTDSSQGKLMFIRNPLDVGQQEQRLGYRWHEGVVELLLWPDADGTAASDPRATLMDPLASLGKIHPLLSEVRSLDFHYLDRAQQWHPNWPPRTQEDLPKAIRLKLVMNDGTAITRLFALP